MEIEPKESGWERVEIEGVSGPRRSVVVVNAPAGRTPVVLVHGIIDNIWRWLTPLEASERQLVIPDRRKLVPLFDLEQTLANPLGSFPRFWSGPGLLSRLSNEQIPAMAYSYQDRLHPMAGMNEAVEALHRVVDWALRYWQTSRVNLVGHSRGGLICRHALLTDSPVMTARRFHQSVGRLIAVCTPHQGSRVAEVARPFLGALAQFDSAAGKVGRVLPAWDVPGSQWVKLLREFITNIGQLTPDSTEVRHAACRSLPELHDGYFALAGSSPAYFCCDLPMVGRLTLPPALAIPELTDSEGDMAVCVASALDIPDAAADTTRVLPLNHLAASMGRPAHDVLVNWLKNARESRE